MRKYNWKYSLISAVAVILIFGSCLAVLAADAASAKTVFYVG